MPPAAAMVIEDAEGLFAAIKKGPFLSLPPEVAWALDRLADALDEYRKEVPA